MAVPQGNDGSWTRTLQRAIFGAGAALIAIETLPQLSYIPMLRDQPGDLSLLYVELVSRLLVLGCAVVAAVVAPGRALYCVALLAALTSLVAASLISWPDSARGTEAAILVPLWAVQTAALTAVALARTRLQVLMGLGGPVLLYGLVESSRSPDVNSFDNAVSGTMTALAVVLLARYLQQGVRYADSVTAESRAARALAARQHAEEHSRAETRRVVHDDVTSALRAIDPVLPATVRRDASRAALAELADRRAPGDRVELMRRLADSSPVPVTLEEGTWPAEPSPPVLDAMLRAGAEALRNVARHASASHVWLSVDTEGRTLVLQVRDDGVGIGDQQVGFGIGSSIVGRMRSVDGDATVAPDASGGTAVTLRWTPPEAVPAHTHAGPDRNPLAVGNRTRGFSQAMLPIVASYTWSAAHLETHSRVLSLTLAAFIAALVFASGWWFARRPATWPDMAVLSILTPLVILVGLQVTPDGSLMDFTSWPVDMAVLVVVFACVEAAPRKIVLPVLACMGAIAVAAWHDPLVAVDEPTGAYFAALVPCVFVAVLGHLVRRGAQAIAVTETALQTRRQELAWTEAVLREQRTLRERLDDDVLPLLQRIALTGAVSHDDIATARLLESRYRDELNLARPLPESVRRAVEASRARGTTVSFRVVEQPGEAWPDDLLEALEQMLSGGTPDIVTVLPGPHPRLVALPALGREERRRLEGIPGVRVTHDEVRTVVALAP